MSDETVCVFKLQASLPSCPHDDCCNQSSGFSLRKNLEIGHTMQLGVSIGDIVCAFDTQILL